MSRERGGLAPGARFDLPSRLFADSWQMHGGGNERRYEQVE